MTKTTNQITRLGHEHLDEVTHMLTRALEGDPLMDFLFPGNSAESRHALMRFSCLVRLELAWPLLGYLESGRIFGAAGLTAPEDIPWPAELHHHYDALKGIIGAGAIARLERYSELTEKRRPGDPHIFLGVVGVDPGKQGYGIGRALLEAIHLISQDHPTSTGVYLDTENPRNVAFYQHMGYQITHQESLGNTRVWCFFRTDKIETPPPS